MEDEIEFPISLESIMSMDLNYTHLKTVLEYILAKLSTTEEAITELNKPPAEQFVTMKSFNVYQAEFDQMKAAVNPLKEGAKRNYELIKEQNAKITALENKLAFNLKNLDTVKDQMKKKMKGMKKKMKNQKAALKDKIKQVHSEISESKKAIESEQLQKQNLNTARFMKQDEKTLELKEKLEEAEKLMKENTNSLSEALTNMVQEKVTISPDLASPELGKLEAHIADLINQKMDAALANQSNQVERLDTKEEDKSQVEPATQDVQGENEGSEKSHASEKSEENTNMPEPEEAKLQDEIFSNESHFKITALEERIHELCNQILAMQDALNDKVCCEDFDDALTALRQTSMPNNSNQEAGPAPGRIMTKDLNTMRDNKKRMDTLEIELNTLKAQADDKHNEIQETFKSIFESKAEAGQFTHLKRLIDGMKKGLDQNADLIRRNTLHGESPMRKSIESPEPAGRIAQILFKLEELEDEIDALKANQSKPGITVDIDKFQEAIDELREVTAKTKQKQDNEILDLKEALETKAGIHIFKSMKEKIISKLGQQKAASPTKDYVTQEQLRKSHSSLRSQLSTLSKLIQVMKNGDDPMIAKKPLGGWSCASCSKGIDKLLGKLAEHQPWQRLPTRESQAADRIARAGPGFSKMLNSLSNAQSQASLLVTHRRTASQQADTASYANYFEQDLHMPKLPSISEPTRTVPHSARQT